METRKIYLSKPGYSIRIPAKKNNQVKRDDPPKKDNQKVFDGVLSNSMLLKEILKHLPHPDLLRTSKVNKKWNYFSREVLREQMCTASMSGVESCLQLKWFNAMLVDSGNVPFSGLSISTPTSCKCKSYQHLPEFTADLLEKMRVRYLSIEIDQLRVQCISKDAIRRIIWKSTNDLEELSLVVGDNEEEFPGFFGINQVGPISWLPLKRLRKLSLMIELGEEDFQDFRTNYTRELIKAAPNLQELYCRTDTAHLELFMPLNLTPIIKDFDFEPMAEYLDLYVKFALEAPQLKKLQFQIARYLNEEQDDIWTETSQEQIEQILRLLLTSSKNTLHYVGLQHLDVILLTHKFSIPPFESANELCLTYGSDVDIREGCQTLKKIPWGKCFPNLKEVYLSDVNFARCNLDLYINQNFREATGQFSCPTVNKLCLDWNPNKRAPEYVQMLKDIFPNVKRFEFEENASVLNEAWKLWPDLEEVVANLTTTGEIPNLDAVFLGVHEDEVKYLLQKSNLELLESLNIVPIRPSLTHLTKLKKLIILVNHPDDPCKGKKAPDFSLTQLTGYCAFDRMMDLRVEIIKSSNCKTWGCQFLDNLEPFVRFTKYKDRKVTF